MAKYKWWQYLLAAFGFPTFAGGHDMGGVVEDQIGSFINSKTGAHLTGAQQEANAFSARMAEEEYARQEEFYLKYQSPKAMLRQGVNPFGINGSAGGHVASGGAPSSVSPGAPQASNLFDIVQLLFGMQQQKRLNDSQIELNDSAARRNDAESTEREINAETLRDMNATEIMEKLSRIDLNSSNVQLIASKILNTDADTDLKAQQLYLVASEIANTDADTDLKRMQISALLTQILKDSKSIEVMSSQIELMGAQANLYREQTNLTREQINLVVQDVENLKQDFDFNEVLKGFETMAAERELGADNFYNSKALPAIKRTIDSLLGWWSGSSTIDLPQRKPARIGYK